MFFSLVLAAALAQEPAPVVLAPTDLRTTATSAVLKTCLASQIRATPSSPLDGRVMLQVLVKRGRIALVTATDAESTAVGLVPCFERELVGLDWDVKHGTFDVPLEFHEPAVAPEPAPVEPSTTP